MWKKNLSKCLALALFASLLACKPKPAPTAESLNAEIKKIEAQFRETKIPDTALVQQYVVLARQLAAFFPKDSLAPSRLIRAAEASNVIGQHEQAIELWAEMQRKYPVHERAADAAFMQAFVAENDLKDRKKAIELYQRFLQQYPKHPIADDAELLIENLRQGLTDQELIEQFKEKEQ
jgi:TolA-binding protein